MHAVEQFVSQPGSQLKQRGVASPWLEEFFSGGASRITICDK
jgi:hypothetical protein